LQRTIQTATEVTAISKEQWHAIDELDAVCLNLDNKGIDCSRVAMYLCCCFFPILA